MGSWSYTLSTRTDLENLLRTDLAAVVDCERNGFDRVATPYEDAIVLFGMGASAGGHSPGFELGIEPLAFADNAQALQGTEVEGVPVLAGGGRRAAQRPRHIRDHDLGRGAANAVGRPPATGPTRSARGAGLPPHRELHSGLLHVSRDLLPYFAMDLPHKVLEHGDAIRQAFDLMGDEISAASSSPR